MDNLTYFLLIVLSLITVELIKIFTVRLLDWYKVRTFKHRNLKRSKKLQDNRRGFNI